MTPGADAELQKWGRMLFALAKPGPRHPSRGVRIPTPDVVRREVRLAVARAPQVMVKVTGGGRGMGVIRAHMNYIDREGDGLIDQAGDRHQGREARREIARQWAREGTLEQLFITATCGRSRTSAFRRSIVSAEKAS